MAAAVIDGCVLCTQERPEQQSRLAARPPPAAVDLLRCPCFHQRPQFRRYSPRVTSRAVGMTLSRVVSCGGLSPAIETETEQRRPVEINRLGAMQHRH
jgi:hypothetical protein